MFPKDAVCGGAGKVSKVIDALNQETTFEYDLAGNLVLTTDALNRSTTVCCVFLGEWGGASSGS